jgi:hypothetical protein
MVTGFDFGTAISSPVALLPRFEPFEELSGISTKKPEIIMLTKFLPLYTDDFKANNLSSLDDISPDFLTGAGELLDLQVQIRTLILNDIIQYIKGAATDANIKAQFESRKKSFVSAFDKTKKDVNALYSLISAMEFLKNSFVMDNHKTYNVLNILPLFSALKDDIKSNITKFVDKNFNLSSLFVDLGYAGLNTDKFSSTKVYQQLCYELNLLLETYSPDLTGLSKENRINDADPITIKKGTISKFSFVDLQTFASDVNSSKTIDDNISTVSSTYDGIIAKLPVSLISKLSCVIFLLAKEFRYSIGLQDAETKKILSDNFGYTVGSINPAVFKSIIGTIGMKTITIVKNQELSFGGLAQKVVGKVAVLPFETKYIEVPDASYTPGSVFFIDSIFDQGSVDVQSLQDYKNTLDNAVQKYAEIIDKFNLFYLPKSKETVKGDIFDISKSFEDLVADPERLLNYISGGIEKFSTDSTQVALFRFARNNSELRNLLFLHCYLKAFEGSYKDATFVVDRIADILNKNLAFDDKSTFDPTSSTTISEIKDQLKDSGSITLISQIIEIIKSVSVIFETKNAFGESKKTLFSGIDKYTLSVLVFDVILDLVSSIGSNIFSTKIHSAGLEYIRISTVLSSPVVGSVTGKINFEKSVSFRTISSLLTFLQDLRTSIQTFLSLMSGSKLQINSIKAIINNPQITKFFFNEAQIILAKSQLDSINENILQSFDMDLNSSIAAGGLSLLTNDSVIDENLRNALLTYFSTDSFLSKNGDNLRILTVGVPWGFSRKLKEKVDLASIGKLAIKNKQTDVIKIKVYKKDLEYQDLIFKPLEYIFELSRFVPRSGILGQIKLGDKLDSIINNILTRDYSVEIIGTRAGLTNAESVMDAQYGFLTTSQKKELIQNHVESYLYELYIKLLTGVNVAEDRFRIDENNEKLVDDEFTKDLLSKHLSAILGIEVKKDTIGGVLSGLSLGGASDKTMTGMTTVTALSSAFSSLETIYMDGEVLQRKILAPKTLERTFNIGVDPDDFELDLGEIYKTESGKDTFIKLLYQDRIIDIETQKAIFMGSLDVYKHYKIQQRNLSSNNIIFEKYFITIETVE